MAPVAFNLDTHRVNGHVVTESYFPAKGVPLAMGRFPKRSESGAVISHRLWRDRFGAEPSAVGRAIRINGGSAVVTGVAPEDFLGPSPVSLPADIWLPVHADSRLAPELGGDVFERVDSSMFYMTGRVRSGVTTSRLEAELDTMARQVDTAYRAPAREDKGRRVLIVPGGRVVPVRKENLPLLLSFPMVLVTMILLIACSNIANMTLARGTARRRESAVRLALGASRARLIRQVMTENVMLSAGAAAIGLLLSGWLMHLLAVSPLAAYMVKLPFGTRVSLDLQPDARVLAVTVALSMLAAVAFGLVPAIRSRRTEIAPALKAQSGSWLRTHRVLGLRNLLVLSQITASLMLLMFTGYPVTGFSRTAESDIGFDPADLHMVSLDPVRDGVNPAVIDRLMERVRAFPGVRSASLMSRGADVRVNGDVASRSYSVDQDYFETMGVAMAQGRGFRRHESGVVIVNQSFVSAAGLEGAVGQQIRVGEDERRFSIAGVVPDMNEELTGDVRPTVYFRFPRA